MNSEKIFGCIRNELKSIVDIINTYKDVSPSDIDYVVRKIANRVEDVKADVELYKKAIEDEQ